MYQSPVLKNEEKEVKAIFTRRREFSITKIHYAANLLDPNYKGMHLTESEIIDAFEIIHDVAENMPDTDGSVVMGELADYRSNQKIFSKSYIWTALNHTTPTSWWSGLCGSTQLSKIATGVLNLPPTSASVERSFSKHANIHSLKRNRLTTDRAAKLLYIAHNLKLAEGDFLSTVKTGQPHENTPREPSILSASKGTGYLSTSAQSDSSAEDSCISISDYMESSDMDSDKADK